MQIGFGKAVFILMILSFYVERSACTAYWFWLPNLNLTPPPKQVAELVQIR